MRLIVSSYLILIPIFGSAINFFDSFQSCDSNLRANKVFILVESSCTLLLIFKFIHRSREVQDFTGVKYKSLSGNFLVFLFALSEMKNK